ncbi:PREDICTED: selenoprotein M-like [Papilio polytes]|uniref:selenoprotein M-like n=1 Tax=Papilio polytes TaxID=76194 RepID=UPI000675CB4B|nr:PREDICTED: selenoprotein M-like [Papilio polytes]
MAQHLNILLLVACLVLTITAAYEKSDIASARIESCRGCSLNRLPEVKGFIMEDAPKYERLDVKFITGADPELILLDKSDRELERILLSRMTRSECNELVQSKGFYKKNTNSEF